jgi:hypothetical protein
VLVVGGSGADSDRPGILSGRLGDMAVNTIAKQCTVDQLIRFRDFCPTRSAGKGPHMSCRRVVT